MVFFFRLKTSHAADYENLSQSMAQKEKNKKKRKSDEDTVNSGKFF